MILVDAVSKLEMFLWILNRISRSITWSLFFLKESQHDLSCGGVSLLIS